MGVDINRTIALTFFLGSALAGAAGVVQGLYFGNIQFNLGFHAGLKAFTAAVLGGIGNIDRRRARRLHHRLRRGHGAQLRPVRLGAGARVRGPDHHARLPPGRPARPAARRAGMTAAVQDLRQRSAAPAGRRCAIARRFSDRHRSISVLVGMVARRHAPAADRPAAAVQRLQQPERLDRRLHHRRHLRPAGARPEHRRRPGRPARPRLRGVLRDRRRTPTPSRRRRSPATTSRSGRCCSSARSSRRCSAILLGAPTLRLRGDYLAIVTLASARSCRSCS